MRKIVFVFVVPALVLSLLASAPGAEKPVEEMSGEELFKKIFGSLTIHGKNIGYYQYISGGEIAGTDYGDQNIAGLMTELMLSCRPIEDGKINVKLKYTQNGQDSEGFFSHALFSPINESFTRSHNKEFRVQKFYYTQHFLDQKLFVSVGKNDAESFIDSNKYANDDVDQFMARIFNNNPFLDAEIPYAPLLAAGVRPREDLELLFVLQSIGWNALSEPEQKDVWEDLFSHPFYGAQITYSPEIGGREGNYRLYGWNFSYEAPQVDGTGTGQRWGVGISIDQEVEDGVGIFARAGYQNEEVYEAPWLLSGGAAISGILPDRKNDTLGLAAAALFSNKDTGHRGTEVYLESYYRIYLSKFLAISPDLQLVLNPRGDSSNDSVFSGLVRGEFIF